MASFTTTTKAVFIPEMWINEVKAQYEAMLLMAQKVKKFYHNGKPGDILHVPQLSNLTAVDVASDGTVVGQAPTETEFQLTINKHKGARVDIPDLVRVQSNYNLRKEYTGKLSYAIRKIIETDLMALGIDSSVQAYNADGTTASAAGAAITASGILKAIQFLDDNDVPDIDRCLVVNPASRNTMLQINNFVSVDYVNQKSTVNKKIGEIYGAEVYVSTLLPTDSNTKKNCLFLHKEAMAVALQIEPRVQSSSQLPAGKLSSLVIADTAYGVKLYRGDTNIVRLVTNAAT